MRGILIWILVLCFAAAPGWAVEETKAKKGTYQESKDTNDDGIMDQTMFYRAGKKHHREADKNFDGKVDRWDYYDEEEVYRRTAKDTNQDGKPDSWMFHEPGGAVKLREYDLNFDGKVDKRQLTEFTMDKRLKIPRHLYIWKEEDKDFDGVIDAYRVRGEKDPVPNRLGQPIDPNFKTIAPPKKKEEAAPQDADHGTKKVIRERGEAEEMMREFREKL